MGHMEDGDSSILVTDADEALENDADEALENDADEALENDADEALENNNEFDSSEAVKGSSGNTEISSIDPIEESTFRPVHVNGDHSSTSPVPVFHSESTNSSDEVDLSLSSNLITVEQESTYALTSDRSTKNDYERETVSLQYSEESSIGGDCDVNGTAQVSETGELLDTGAPTVSQDI